MFCSKCGTEITEGMFCPKCGTRIAEEVKVEKQPDSKMTESEQKAAPAPAPKQVQPAENKKSPMNAKVIGGILAAVVVFLAIVIVVCMHKPTINLNKYVTVDFEGYETLGRATATVDWNAIGEDYGKKIKVNKSALKKDMKKELGADYSNTLFGDIIDDYLDESTVDLLSACVSGSLDRSNGLSNGDEVIYSWDCSDEEAEKYLMLLKRSKYQIIEHL